MTHGDDPLVFDTGPMRHFAQHSWLGVLKFLAQGRPVLIPESVERELRRQVHEVPELQQVLDAEWISVERNTDIEVLTAFARYEHRLAVGEKNLGECGVLALGEARGWEIVIDDHEARSLAEEKGLRVTATLPLLCQAIRDDQLTVLMVDALADDLISGAYHLPFGPGGFRRWAVEEGHLDLYGE